MEFKNVKKLTEPGVYRVNMETVRAIESRMEAGEVSDWTEALSEDELVALAWTQKAIMQAAEGYDDEVHFSMFSGLVDKDVTAVAEVSLDASGTVVVYMDFVENDSQNITQEDENDG